MVSRDSPRLDKVTTAWPLPASDSTSEREPARWRAPLSPAALVQRASQYPASISSEEARHLHRALGNRAVGRLLQRDAAARSSAAPASHAASTIEPELTLGPSDDRAEQEADRVARQVIERFDAEAPLPGGRALPPRVEDGEDLRWARPAAVPVQNGERGMAIPPEVETAIHEAQGGGQALPGSVRGRMERAFGIDFGGVRVHLGAQADRLNRSLQASAFTAGGDIFFRHGAYAPESLQGQAVLAHELTHVVQQRGAARAAPATGRRTVLQRLPTKARIEAEVGAARPAKDKSLLYKSVLQSLDVYDTAAKNPVPATDTGRRVDGTKLDTLLNDVIDACRRYTQKHHKDARAQRITRLAAQANEEKQRLLEAMQNALYNDPGTTRSWEEAIAFQRAGVTPTAKAKVGAAVSPGTDLTIMGGGQVAAVYEGTWTDLAGAPTYTGVYKREPATVVLDPETGGEAYYAHERHGGKLGIPFEHPNYGARNIAMYRICRLLGLDVIPRTDFALHRGDLGYVMTKIAGGTIVKKERVEVAAHLKSTRKSIKEALAKAAKGDEQAQLQIKRHGWKREGKRYFAHAAGETPAVTSAAYASGITQQGMTNLQLIDAICRGTDRNQTNYLLEFDASDNVVGVKGIDNDFAFGEAYLTGDKLKGFVAFCGVPPVVDETVFQKVMQTTDEAVMAEVRGILPEAEVKVLGDQYHQVHWALTQMARTQIIKTWGQQSLQQLQAAGPEGSYFMRDYSLLQSMESAGKKKT